MERGVGKLEGQSPKNLLNRKLIKGAYKDRRNHNGGAIILFQKVKQAGLHNEESGVHIIPLQ